MSIFGGHVWLRRGWSASELRRGIENDKEYAFTLAIGDFYKGCTDLHVAYNHWFQDGQQ